MSQQKYIMNLLEEANMLGCEPVNTLINPNSKLGLDDGEVFYDGRYRRMVGKLIYLTVTWTDITFAMGVVSQYMHTSHQPH